MSGKTFEAKSRAAKADTVTTKLCLKCGLPKDAKKDFYANRDWTQQLGKDIWCKNCVGKCATKDNIKEYFWNNHRQWDEKIWEGALTKAKRLISTNNTYMKAPEEIQKTMLERLTAQQVPLVMSTAYKYIDYSKSDALTYEEAKANGDIPMDENEEQKIYSEAFDGYYTQRDLNYLESYYNKLQEDFTFDNESIRDYARKVCKASLQADRAQNDYCAGRCQFSDVKDALTLFDMLSKSANFAACKRKTGESSGLTSWSETTLYLMTNKKIKQRKIEWPQDVVDRVTNNLRHLTTALGLDGT